MVEGLGCLDVGPAAPTIKGDLSLNSRLDLFFLGGDEATVWVQFEAQKAVVAEQNTYYL